MVIRDGPKKEDVPKSFVTGKTSYTTSQQVHSALGTIGAFNTKLVPAATTNKKFVG